MGRVGVYISFKKNIDTVGFQWEVAPAKNILITPIRKKNLTHLSLLPTTLLERGEGGGENALKDIQRKQQNKTKNPPTSHLVGKVRLLYRLS